MASLVIFKCIFAIVFLTCIEYNTASKSDISSLINILGQRHSSNKRPIIVVIDTHKSQNKPKSYVGDSSESSDEGIVSRLAHILQHDKINKLLSPKKSTLKPRVHLKQNRHKVQKLRAEHSLEARNVLRSPIVKTLLRISNSIQCQAQDECQDKCNDKFNGKKASKCEVQCEEKFECEQEEDPCEKDDCADSCGETDGCAMSTKGERYVTEPACKKC